jgi:hypothetical protein
MARNGAMNIWELMMQSAQAGEKPEAKALYNPRNKAPQAADLFVPPPGRRLAGMPSVLAPGRAPAQEGVVPEEVQATDAQAPVQANAPKAAPGQPASTGSPYSAARDTRALEAFRAEKLSELNRGRDKTFADLENTINEMKDYKGRSRFERLDLSPGLAFVDSLTGSNLQSGYTAPQTTNELRQKIADYQEKMVNQQNKAIDSIQESLGMKGTKSSYERALASVEPIRRGFLKRREGIESARRMLESPEGLRNTTALRGILKASGEDRISDKDLTIVQMGAPDWVNRIDQMITTAVSGVPTEKNLRIALEVIDIFEDVLNFEEEKEVDRLSNYHDVIYGGDNSMMRLVAENSFGTNRRGKAPKYRSTSPSSTQTPRPAAKPSADSNALIMEEAAKASAARKTKGK